MKAEASSLFSRREIMGSAAAATVLAFGAGAARAAPAAPAVPATSAAPAAGPLRMADPQAVMKAASTGQLVFDIAWTDIVGGTLVSRFETVGDEIRAFTNIDASYFILWMPAIDYHLAVRETWRGDRLVAFESDTRDRGRRESVRGQAVDGGFEVTGRKGRLMAPADIIPATFWNPEIVTRDVVLDPQKGTLEDQEVKGHDRTTLSVMGQPLPVDRYRLDSVVKGDVYYEDKGQWAGGRFKKKGFHIDFRRRA